MGDPLERGQIGRYKLLGTLGQGAMARVYLAELESLGAFRRKVALKVVLPEFVEDEKFLQLLGREAMIGSHLQHPNIVETLEFNEADGCHFLALEYVEGETLESLLETAREAGTMALEPLVALDLCVQMLRGLHYAHELRSPEDEPMGIVHRDLKPANLMLSRHGMLKVMDFGIAKARVTTANITKVGQVRGTPIYMAPEQVTGRAMDGRSDQFAAATVLYELVTGKQLFVANNLITIMQRVAKADVGGAVEELADVHPRLGWVAAKMWSKEAGDRYGDCGMAADDIEQVIQGLRGGPARTEPSDGVKRRRKRRRRIEQKPTGVQGLVAGFLRFMGIESKKKKVRRKRRKVHSGPPSPVHEDSETEEVEALAPFKASEIEPGATDPAAETGDLERISESELLMRSTFDFADDSGRIESVREDGLNEPDSA